MGMKKVINALLDRIEEKQSDINAKRQEISVLYGYKKECERLRSEVQKLKHEVELKDSLIEEQSVVIKSIKDGMVN